jgi:hypothetical protein
MPERVNAMKGRGGEYAAALPLTQTGRLVAGVHTYTLAELRPLVATTPYRRMMWSRFMAFLGLPILLGNFSYAYMGGGYPTETARPHDIDLVLQTREAYGPEAFHALERFFIFGLENIQEVYGIHLHFWMENAPPGICDFRAFFQYARPRLSHEFDQQGLVRIALLAPDIREQYQRLLGGFELPDEEPTTPPTP